MLGYVIAALLLVYFLGLWPHFEGLPPRSARIRRQRLAGAFGLHDNPSVGELYLTPSMRQELCNNVTYTDAQTYSKISNSNHFYLVESRKSVLSLYCGIHDYIGKLDYNTLQSTNFIKVPIEEHLLIRFLKELNHQKEGK